MTPTQLHELAAAVASLNPKPHEKCAAVERMISDGRAEWVTPHEWRLTAQGLEWLGRIR